MKRQVCLSNNRSRCAKAACTVSAAALMLGVSHAAVVGFNFQVGWNDDNNDAYTGFPVTATAFGIAPSSWENLAPMPTGYGSVGSGPFSLTQSVDTTTSTNGLNPLPEGSLTVSWQANAANTSGFGIADPVSCHGGNQPDRGEQEVYYGFLRDGVFVYTSPTTILSNYQVTISGLKSVFPNSEYAVRLVASTDSGKLFTNAIISSATKTSTVSYTAMFTNFYDPNVFAPNDPSRVAGIMGGLSSTSAAFNDDSITIAGGPAYDGPTSAQNPTGRQYTGSGPDPGPGIASTISGIMIADSPVIVYSPKTPAGLCAGGSAGLSVDAFGVPPLSYQWRKDGVPISGATTSAYTVPDVSAANAGMYDVVVNNQYGSATSAAAAIAGPNLLVGTQPNLILDTKPTGPAQDGVNNGATWLVSSSDGTKTRTGVMNFNGTNDNDITLIGGTNLETTNGTITFWMRSAGVTSNETNSAPGALILTFGDGYDSDYYGISIGQDALTGAIVAGTIALTASDAYSQNTVATVQGNVNVSDGNWHFIDLDFDQTTNGGVDLFVDGQFDNSMGNALGFVDAQGLSWSWPTNAQLISVGLSHKANWRPYNGQLDDIRFYNHILTITEAAQIYASDAIVDTNTLQLRWNFDAAPVSGYSLDWTCGQSLLSSTNVNGPYNVIQPASSPWNITTAGAQNFYKTQ